MSLKPVVDSIDAVAEPLRELYVEKDGKFHLTVEGMVPSSRLNEFRDNNIALARQVEDMTKKFSGVDLDAYNAMTEQQRKIRDKELIDAGKVEELFSERVGPMKASHEKELLAEHEKAANLQSHLERLLIDGAVSSAAVKAGVRATAVDDVLLRARQVFKVMDGKGVPMDGDKVLFGKNGEPMSEHEWLATLADKAPHLFEPSQGAGSRGNGATGGAGPRVNRNDAAAFLANLDGVAKGKVKVI